MRQPRQRVLSASGPKDEPGLGEHNWFLQPHEIIALVLTVTLVIYVVFTRDTSNTAGNVKAYALPLRRSLSHVAFHARPVLAPPSLLFLGPRQALT